MWWTCVFAVSHRNRILKVLFWRATLLNVKKIGQELHPLSDICYLCLPSANGHFLSSLVLEGLQQPLQSTAGTCRQSSPAVPWAIPSSSNSPWLAAAAPPVEKLESVVYSKCSLTPWRISLFQVFRKVFYIKRTQQIVRVPVRSGQITLQKRKPAKYYL